ncbi:MAG: hypothetical protein R2769_09735 [Saprospiraceae bacterium]
MVEAGQEIKERVRSSADFGSNENGKRSQISRRRVVEEIKVEKGKPVDKGTVLIKLQ